jgi:uncharacterized protein YggE
MEKQPSARRRVAVGLAVLAAAGAASVGTIAMTGSSASPDRAHAQSDDTTTTTEDPVPATDSDRPTISVTGTAKVSVTPDTAHLSMGVRHRADSAEEALNTVSTKTSDLIKTLTDAGIAKKDIQTTNLSVWPSYGGPRGEEIIGYEASNSVTVKTTDIAGVGALIDEISGVVGDSLTLDGISFSVGDPDAALADVRGDAVADARAKAQQYVAGEDLTVGAILHIVENGSVPPPMPMYARAAGDTAAEAAVPIEPGEQELSVDVTVIFELE